MVFLRPVVVRDGAATEALSMGRYEQMRLTQQASQPVDNAALPVQGAAVLPERQPRPAAPSAATPPAVTPPAAKP